MKKSLLFIIGMVLILASCTTAIAQRTIKNVSGTSFDVIEVDSCEYIIGNAGYKGYMAHKGNCKYCKERMKYYEQKKETN